VVVVVLAAVVDVVAVAGLDVFVGIVVGVVVSADVDRTVFAFGSTAAGASDAGGSIDIAAVGTAASTFTASSSGFSMTAPSPTRPTKAPAGIMIRFFFHHGREAALLIVRRSFSVRRSR
jgi:hypothetical protein